MKSAPKHPKESERLKALDRLKILDTLPEKDFDDLTLIASQIFNTPISLVSLIDEKRQWFKSRQGLEATETPREFAFCAHAILEEDLFIVSDSRTDDRFRDNPLVTGDPRVVFYAGAPLISPDGYPIGTLCVIDHEPKTLSESQRAALKALSNQVSRLLDLRSQLEIQKLMNYSLELKNVAVENLVEGVVLQDTKFNIIEFNSAALSVLGMTADQLKGKSSMDPEWHTIKEDGSPLPGGEHPAVLALKSGKKQHNQIMGVYRHKDDLRWIKVNSTPIFSSDSGIPSHAVTTFSDITVEKKSTSLIAESKASLQRLLDGIPSMIGHWSKDLTNLSANNAYSEYFGKTPKEIRGMAIQELLGKETFKLNYPYMKNALNGESQTFERALTIPDGSIRHVLANYLPDYQDDKVTGFFVIVTDITEIKRLENERQNMAAKMIESAKLSSLGEMAGGVAHEINTPLAIITAKASMLLEAYEKGAVPEAESIKQIGKIKTTAERIAKIIQGLRLFSRDSTNDLPETFAISTLLDATLDLCQEKLTQSEIKIDKVVENDFQVVGKLTELSQVLMNLISNSIDAIEFLPDKWIQLRVVQNEQWGKIEVMDSGLGISPHVVEKMMNPFFTTKELGKGTGLGLSISAGIIKSHGGKFWLDTKCSHTCFCIELPLQPPQKKESLT